MLTIVAQYLVIVIDKLQCVGAGVGEHCTEDAARCVLTLSLVIHKYSQV